MGYKDQLQQEKPWAVLGWTRKQWKRSKMWKKAEVSEDKMARLVQSLDQETVQILKDHAQAEVLVDKIFGADLAVDSD